MARPAREANFFRIWSPNMAYILGYWWADGHMRIKKNTGAHEIAIASNDWEHLTVMAACIGEKYYLRRVLQNADTFSAEFCSKQMFQDIEAHGGTPAKSKTIKFPDVPTEYVAHFVRGVIDGDGTLAWNGIRPVIQIYSGSREFLEKLATEVERATGIPAPNIAANRANWYLKWSTIRAKCLAAWLYEINEGLALPRKAAIAAQFIDWQPRKRPAQKMITEVMQQNFSLYLPS